MLFFLKWYNPATWLSEVDTPIIGGVVKALRTMFYEISTMIYKLIIHLYNLFEILCAGRILDSNIFEELSKRVGVVLGVIMLFIVIITFIRMLLDPDTIMDKNKGAVNVIKKTILVIIMLGTANFVFLSLYNLQRTIVKEHIISKLLVPYDVDTKNFGSALSAELFLTFYNIDYTLREAVESNEDIKICQQETFVLKDRIYSDKDFNLGKSCLNESTTITGADGKEAEVTIMDFNWLLMVAVGIFVIYILVVYCIMVGVRMVQLALLEIVSPMAFVSYLSPTQDTMFQKWTKMYFATYIDVFIRIAIINFVIFLIAIILGSGSDAFFWNSLGDTLDGYGEAFVTIIMILALLMFAKKAPELIKELFPSSSSKLNLGISSPKELFNSMLGGNFIGSIPKRAYGAAAVGLGVASGNIRRTIGKILDTKKDYDSDIIRGGMYDQTRLNNLRQELARAEEVEDDMAIAALESEIARETRQRDEHNERYRTEVAKKRLYQKNVGKWMRRGVTGTLRGTVGGGLSGMRTTDKNARRNATKTGIDRQKADWKLSDAGYGMKEKVSDIVRNSFYRDTQIGQLGEASDYEVSALQKELSLFQEHCNEKGIPLRNIQANKLGNGYILFGNDGSKQVISENEMSSEELIIADLNARIGKAQGMNSSLHQRENEKKNN